VGEIPPIPSSILNHFGRFRKRRHLGVARLSMGIRPATLGEHEAAGVPGRSKTGGLDASKYVRICQTSGRLQILVDLVGKLSHHQISGRLSQITSELVHENHGIQLSWFSTLVGEAVILGGEDAPWL
jgi:hypothetical protein